MLEVPEDRCERYRLFQAIDDAFKAGDFTRLGNALGNSARWFDEAMPFEFGLGHPLEYAIYWSPLRFIGELIGAGANPNYVDDAGFPALHAALSTSRSDRHGMISLLLRAGADPDQRGFNDWTPLHRAVAIRDTEAVRLLLEAGADPRLRTRIDDCATAQEEAEAAGFDSGASLLSQALEARAEHDAG